MGLVCIYVFCNCALLPVSQREFHPVSHRNLPELIVVLPLLLVLAYSIYSVADSNKPNAALNREKSEQKALSSFHFECTLLEESVKSGYLLQTETNAHEY